ncbi:MAG TPA: nucleoside-triphosphatase [Spirochaetota bacterium]|nr:nucleoside-triphosphatase [Spirochaetota bacterium]HPI87795.1 nucleoside-triphosphatase [Spirochaetota bacterium]HPR47029.1 nucleoside-triphosphatase [Spirochaetota bacterium]
MVYIIHGEINQGKTTRIQSLYRELNRGDGFISKKIFKHLVFCGYEATRLSTGESTVQSLKSNLFPENRIPFYICGSFSFFRESFIFTASIIDDIIIKGIDPVYIDEIGPLELQGKGHYECFQKIAHSGRTVYCTARNSCLEKIISGFGLKNYSLIRL